MYSSFIFQSLLKRRSGIRSGYCLLLFLLANPIFIIANSLQQVGELKLSESSKIIENRLELYLSGSDVSRIKKISGKKEYFRGQQVIWNGDSVLVNEIHTRGQSSLSFPRKSFSITFNKKVYIRHDGKDKEMKNVYALSLVMDKNYLNNRLAFGLLEKLNLSGLFFTYAEVRINDESEGIYLFMERPQDWAIKNQNSPYVIRRGYENNISKVNTSKDLDKAQIRKYKSNYKKINSVFGKFHGEPLYEELSKYIDLEMYMRWLAFNFFVRNGDYTDEVYFYVDPVDSRFKIIPWDYDELFAANPHEGRKQRYAILNNKLIFSSEELFDRKIAADEYLYGLYLMQLREVFEQLKPAVIQKELETIYAELFPYYANSEIMATSETNFYPNTTLATLESGIKLVYQQLIDTRSSYLGL